VTASGGEPRRCVFLTGRKWGGSHAAYDLPHRLRSLRTRASRRHDSTGLDKSTTIRIPDHESFVSCCSAIRGRGKLCARRTEHRPGGGWSSRTRSVRVTMEGTGWDPFRVIRGEAKNSAGLHASAWRFGVCQRRASQSFGEALLAAGRLVERIDEGQWAAPSGRNSRGASPIIPGRSSV